MALWISLTIHAAGVEIYFRLTPKQSERLRKVSRERWIEAGLESDEKSSTGTSSSTDVTSSMEKQRANQDGNDK